MQDLESEIWFDPETDNVYLRVRIWENKDKGRNMTKRGIVFKLSEEYIASLPTIPEGMQYPRTSPEPLKFVGAVEVTEEEKPVCNDGLDTSVCCQAPTKRVSDTIWICTKCGK
jgi:hypothetical protein